MNDIERVMAQLDQDQPNWAIDWALGDELRDYANDTRIGQEAYGLAKMRNSVANRLLHRILNAAIGAGVVK